MIFFCKKIKKNEMGNQNEEHKNFSFAKHIHKILEMVYPDVQISKKVMSNINSMINVVAKKLIIEASTNSNLAFDSNNIITAVQTIFPDILATHAISEGNRILTKNNTKPDYKSQGLLYPIIDIKTLINQYIGNDSATENAAIYLAAVLEYITAEIIELSGNTMKEFKRKRILPRDISFAIHKDEELNTLFG